MYGSHMVSRSSKDHHRDVPLLSRLATLTSTTTKITSEYLDTIQINMEHPDDVFFLERLEMFLQKNVNDIHDFASREGRAFDAVSTCSHFFTARF